MFEKGRGGYHEVCTTESVMLRPIRIITEHYLSKVLYNEI